jgi:hypothetical protein
MKEEKAGSWRKGVAAEKDIQVSISSTFYEQRLRR